MYSTVGSSNVRKTSLHTISVYPILINFALLLSQAGRGLPPRSEQVNGAVANEIKHVHSPEVIVVLDPRYDLSYKALYISTCSIALIWCKSYEIYLSTANGA